MDLYASHVLHDVILHFECDTLLCHDDIFAPHPHPSPRGTYNFGSCFSCCKDQYEKTACFSCSCLLKSVEICFFYGCLWPVPRRRCVWERVLSLRWRYPDHLGLLSNKIIVASWDVLSAFDIEVSAGGTYAILGTDCHQAPTVVIDVARVKPPNTFCSAVTRTLIKSRMTT